ncbi:MAG: hypothetical protein ACLPKB_19475 [Xanthobacteraceae bacterium]
MIADDLGQQQIIKKLVGALELLPARPLREVAGEKDPNEDDKSSDVEASRFILE